MKRIVPLSILVAFLLTQSAQALSWAYEFVVWDGKVYVVQLDEIIGPSAKGNKIGSVQTETNHRTGSYYGDASNYFPKGTAYFEIIGTPPSEAIAVEDGNQLKRAVYVHDAPFHIMNILTSPRFTIVMLLAVIAVLGFVFLKGPFRKKLQSKR